MPTVDVDALEMDLRKRVRDLITAAQLPNVGPWGRGVVAEPLPQTGTMQDRINNGKFQIRLGTIKFTIDRGATPEKCELRWKITVNTDNGEVIALPILNGNISPSIMFTPQLLEALGFPVRKIGELGKLLTFVPEGSDVARMRLGIPVIWGAEHEILLLRREWAHRLTAQL